MDKTDECGMAAQIRESNTFTNEQIMQLLTRGRMIVADTLARKSSVTGQKDVIQVGILTVDEGGKPVKIVLPCHDLVELVNYIAKEALQ